MLFKRDIREYFFRHSVPKHRHAEMRNGLDGVNGLIRRGIPHFIMSVAQYSEARWRPPGGRGRCDVPRVTSRFSSLYSSYNHSNNLRLHAFCVVGSASIANMHRDYSGLSLVMRVSP